MKGDTKKMRSCQRHDPTQRDVTLARFSVVQFADLVLHAFAAGMTCSSDFQRWNGRESMAPAVCGQSTPACLDKVRAAKACHALTFLDR